MFQEGERIFMAGAAGEPTALVRDALAAGTHMFTTFVPGVNRIDPAWLGGKSRITSLFAHPAMMRDRPEAFDRLPIAYGGFLKLLRSGLRFDTAIVQVSPPDAQGRFSLGPMAEFSLLAARQAGRTIAVVNARTSYLPGAPYLSREDFDQRVDADTTLPVYEIVEDEIAHRIASHILTILPNRPTLQLGLGKVPNALTQGLSSLRQLRFHSGMLSDGIMTLDAAGALDRDAVHRTTALLGSPALYDWARDHPEIRIAGCDEIHDPRVLNGLDRLVAINSALEVDLNGQCDLEYAGGRAISGPGGAPDFARAASLSPGGCSIVALPASVNGVSRIVPRLSSGNVTLGRSDVDIVVTEHGLADLRGKSTTQRCKALIAIAAPDHRSGLEAAGEDLKYRSIQS